MNSEERRRRLPQSRQRACEQQMLTEPDVHEELEHGSGENMASQADEGMHSRGRVERSNSEPLISTDEAECRDPYLRAKDHHRGISFPSLVASLSDQSISAEPQRHSGDLQARLKRGMSFASVANNGISKMIGKIMTPLGQRKARRKRANSEPLFVFEPSASDLKDNAPIHGSASWHEHSPDSNVPGGDGFDDDTISMAPLRRGYREPSPGYTYYASGLSKIFNKLKVKAHGIDPSFLASSQNAANYLCFRYDSHAFLEDDEQEIVVGNILKVQKQWSEPHNVIPNQNKSAMSAQNDLADLNNDHMQTAEKNARYHFVSVLYELILREMLLPPSVAQKLLETQTLAQKKMLIEQHRQLCTQRVLNDESRRALYRVPSNGQSGSAYASLSSIVSPIAAVLPAGPSLAASASSILAKVMVMKGHISPRLDTALPLRDFEQILCEALVRLRTTDRQGLQEFVIENGQSLFEILNFCAFRKPCRQEEMAIISRSLQCLEVITNNNFGIQLVLRFPTALVTLAVCSKCELPDRSNSSSPQIAIDGVNNAIVALEVLVRLMWGLQGGSQKVMAALEEVANIRHCLGGSLLLFKYNYLDTSLADDQPCLLVELCLGICTFLNSLIELEDEIQRRETIRAGIHRLQLFLDASQLAVHMASIPWPKPYKGKRLHIYAREVETQLEIFRVRGARDLSSIVQEPNLDVYGKLGELITPSLKHEAKPTENNDLTTQIDVVPSEKMQVKLALEPPTSKSSSASIATPLKLSTRKGMKITHPSGLQSSTLEPRVFSSSLPLGQTSMNRSTRQSLSSGLHRVQTSGLHMNATSASQSTAKHRPTNNSENAQQQTQRRRKNPPPPRPPHPRLQTNSSSQSQTPLSTQLPSSSSLPLPSTLPAHANATRLPSAKRTKEAGSKISLSHESAPSTLSVSLPTQSPDLSENQGKRPSRQNTQVLLTETSRLRKTAGTRTPDVLDVPEQKPQWQAVVQLLARADLAAYERAFYEEGFDTLERVSEMDAEDFAAVHMRRGHIKSLLKVLKQIESVAPNVGWDGPQTPSPRAPCELLAQQSSPLFSSNEVHIPVPGSSSSRPFGFKVIPNAALVLQGLIGRGSFGDVHLCEYQGGKCVAKKIRWAPGEPVSVDADVNERQLQEQQKRLTNEVILREAETMEMCKNHPHVVTLFGVCLDSPGNLLLISELCERGSLFDAVVKPRRSAFNFQETLELARQGVSGLVHLHSLDVVHRDIAARNFLLDSRGIVKVCDFGLAKIKPRQMSGSFDHSNSGDSARINPLRWAAPESLRDGKYSPASDVYMCGVFLWELWIREQPFRDLEPIAAALQVLQGQRPRIDDDRCAERPELVDLLQSCWRASPLSRPSMIEVLASLRTVQQISFNTLEANPSSHCANSDFGKKNSAKDRCGRPGVIHHEYQNGI